MGTARQDFERFVRWLHEPDRTAPEDARRFANMVLANFDTVAETARQRNNRSARLATLARQSLATTSAELPQLTDANESFEWPWARLQRLTLGPFRGFKLPQDFDLRMRLVLCYGPNGSGKSSFCEALEYALLGSVAEAESKRLGEQEYLSNLHSGTFERPILTATDRDNREVEVRADANAFRFCFVEKNRIDAFSRIAARPPGRRSELIATLFGMDSFNDFASNFNESMDASLTLGNTFQTILAQNQQSLVADREIVDGERTRLEELDRVGAEYAAAYADNLKYIDLSALIGAPDAPGRLQQLEAQINEIPPTVTGLGRERLEALYANVDSALEALRNSQQKLEARRNQASFRNLYKAVLEFRDVNSQICPACNTPITQAIENPFEKADAGLRELAELAEIEEHHYQLERALEHAGQELRDELTGVRRFLESDGEGGGIIATYIDALHQTSDTPEWWASVYSPREDERETTPSLEAILTVCDKASLQDIQTKVAITMRQDVIDERDRLNTAQIWITRHEMKKSQVVADAASARERIANWEIMNAGYIGRAHQESEDNVRDLPIKRAYDNFYSLLQQFRDQLPGMLMADLNLVTIELYNEFNYADREEDKLADLHLPLSGEDKIEIAFRDNPEHYVDALAALSEGHIRCLGLAILLAKAVNIDAPFIVFDDAINAIDHDHRGGIRAALFESDRFQETQLIVTCHSPEFIKDIENNLRQPHRNECKSYVLQHHNGDHQPRVNPDAPTSNYLARANQAMGRFDPRDALSNSRRALELLTNKIWKWLESHGIGDIAVQVEGPRKEPQLRMLCEALRKKMLESRTFAHASKQPLIDGLNQILGIPQQNLIWTLLNKGTHEEPDRDDFDQMHVATVISVLESIDRLDLRPNH